MASVVKICSGLALAAALAAPAYAEDGLITQKSLSLGMAQTIANGAMEACKAMGYRISVAIVDRDGLTMVMLRGDNAGLHTPEGAERKAYTARTFGNPSADFLQRMKTTPDAHASETYSHVLALPGGLPIKVGNDVIGGAGLSGTPGVDEPCVQAGLDKVADQLK